MKINKKWICGGETLPKAHWTNFNLLTKDLLQNPDQNLVQLNFNQSTSRVERLFTSVRQMRSIKLGWGNELYFHQFQTRPTSGAIFVVDSFCTSLVSGTTSQLELCSSIEVLSSTARVTSVKYTR